MPRLLFEKTGNAVWISHLDLMRVFQRAFKRAGLHLTHTQGFNPRPSVSIALPLSVGVESLCELLDFDLEGDAVSPDEIRDRLNRTLIDGVRVLSVYDNGLKIKNLSYLACQVDMEYDNGVPENTVSRLCALFAQPEVIVEKKSKNGITEQNISPMIKRIRVTGSDSSVTLHALVCCQNPTLNPAQLTAAVEKYLPDCRPDFSRYKRLELYDSNETVFR